MTVSLCFLLSIRVFFFFFFFFYFFFFFSLSLPPPIPPLLPPYRSRFVPSPPWHVCASPILQHTHVNEPATSIFPFQIRVRVIEARSLSGSKSLRPICKATIMNQRRQTRAHKSTNKPWFNELFFFNFHEAPSKLFEETLRLDVRLRGCFLRSLFLWLPLWLLPLRLTHTPPCPISVSSQVVSSRTIRSDALIGSFFLDLGASKRRVVHRAPFVARPPARSLTARSSPSDGLRAAYALRHQQMGHADESKGPGHRRHGLRQGAAPLPHSPTLFPFRLSTALTQRRLVCSSPS